MEHTILEVPQEILEQIVYYLSLEDFSNRQRARLELYTKISGESTNRLVVEVPHSQHRLCICTDICKSQMSHSKKGKMAKDRVISYAIATRRVSQRRQPYAQAKPNSAVTLGHGNSFIYRNGTLCYTNGSLIRILDVHGASDSEIVIDIRQGLKEEAELWEHTSNVQRFFSDDKACRLLNYQDDILSCAFLGEDETPFIFVVIDTRATVPSSAQKRIRLVWDASGASERLVLGTRRSLNWLSKGSDGWELCVINLDNPAITKSHGPGRTVINNLLHDTIGKGSIVSKIHKEWIYVLHVRTSQTSSSSSPSSLCYQCTRFFLDDPQFICPERRRADTYHIQYENTRIWRKSNDVRTTESFEPDLALQVDERTGALMIVERRQGHFYFQPLIFAVIDDDTQAFANKVQLGDLHSVPSHWCHGEVDNNVLHQEYNLGYSTWLDVSSHKTLPSGLSTQSPHTISLRSSSRTRASPLRGRGSLAGQCP